MGGANGLIKRWIIMDERSSKKLYRSTNRKMIGGVCAGISDYLNIDITLARILWLILTIMMHGFGVLLYLICLVIIPQNPNEEKIPAADQQHSQNWGLYIGTGMVLLGLWIFMDRSFRWFPFNFHWAFWHIPRYVIWPGILIALGLLMVFRGLSTADSPVKDLPFRTFTRSRTQRMFGGVCGGLAQYFKQDVTLIRVGYVLLTLLTGFWLGTVAYIVIVVAVPEESLNQTAPPKSPAAGTQTPLGQ
jgi:phage shock protein C